MRNQRPSASGSLMKSILLRESPAYEARTLEGLGFTDRFELTAGGFRVTYQGNQARPLDMLIQPKYVLHSSHGAIPSLSVAAASLSPIASIGMVTPWLMSAGFC